MSSPESQFLTLTSPTTPTPIPESQIESIFNALQPIKPSFLIGSWDGGSLDTGHPGHKSLTAMRWAGKTFKDVDDVEPIVLWEGEDKGDGKGERRVWSEEWGGASLREMVFRGVVSTAMIYDIKPIFDHFRYVNEDMVVGAMDSPKVMGAESTYYFYLMRGKE